jgi:predicted ATP-grasp superfamily ATP-dependent carboligase
LATALEHPSRENRLGSTLSNLYQRDLDDYRGRASSILTAVATRKSLEASRRRHGADKICERHLNLLREGLARKIQVIVYGRHSPDWMSALAPTAPVWPGLDLVREVVHVDATEDDLPARIRRDCYPILLPLMEEHARAAPVNIASLTPDAELIDLLADKGLFAAYLLERNLAAFAPQLYQSHEDVDYPCIVKRTDLNGGLGVDQVLDREALDQIVEAKSLHREKFIIQAWVGGTDEYVTHAVLRDGEIVWDKTFHYDLGQDNALRTAQVTSDYRIERTPTPTSLRDVLSAIAADLGLSGPVNVDYKIVDGRPVIFEINPRLGGSLMRPENVDLLAEALKAVVDGAVASDRFLAGVIRSSNLFDARFYTNSELDFGDFTPRSITRR